MKIPEYERATLTDDDLFIVETGGGRPMFR